MKTKIGGLLLIMMMALVALVPGVGAGSSAQTSDEPLPYGGNTDNLAHPLGDKQTKLRKEAVQAKLNGKVDGPIARVGDGQYIELEREYEDSIWTVLGDFGTEDSPYEILQSGLTGPLHNQIPEPDRSVDNTTIWNSDFSEAYYENLLFSEAPGAVSMRNFYIEQSSNRYTVNGDVTDWTKVPYNAAHYGRNYCGGIVCAQTWSFVDDSVDNWFADAKASGMTKGQINNYLAQFDVWDRYDMDGDGDFNEPDGYIDHFQSVHAGQGEETGGGDLGEDAIWSHRWYAYFNADGPDGTGPGGYGGVQIGNSDYWVGDYTIEPENGGVGVFSHEFGHDLGLPDLYDTSGNTGGAENSTGFWTLMSSGSYGNSGIASDGIGSEPIPFSAYEKIYLGWSNSLVLGYGEEASIRMGPSTYNTKHPQQLIMLLPNKEVEFPIGDPYSGDYQYYSGSGDNLDNLMTRTVTLPNGSISLSAMVNYDIELDWDYAYLYVDGDEVETNLSTDTDPNGQNFGHGITGSSNGDWVELTADLSAYAGETVDISFRYWTDVAQANPGMQIDDVAIPGQALDDAETDAGWTYDGFERVGSTVSLSFFNAYFAEYRTYKGYDEGLQTGPYNFGFLDNPLLGNWVEHFPYQDGLLVWYYDTSFGDNNVGDHCLSGRCGGLYLPVDAHPDLLIRPDNGQVWRPRMQSYDSTFNVGKTDRICLYANSINRCYGRLNGNRKFDDTKSYWVAPDPSIGNNGWASVPLPATGTTILVRGVSNQGDYIKLRVNK